MSLPAPIRRLATLLALSLAAAAALPAAPASAGVPMCYGEPATIVGTPGDDLFDGITDNSIYGTPGPDVIHGLGGNDAIYADAGDDLICGGEGQDITLNGQWGNDKIDGGASERDALSFIDFGDPAGVVANLATGEADGDESGHDTFKNVESIQGTLYNDKLTGDGKSNLLVGIDGNDKIFGGGGEDMITGDGALVAPGDDTMKGGAGVDYVSFSSAPGSVSVNLASGTSAGEGSDEFSEFEGVIGSEFSDTLAGTKGDNYFVGDPLGNAGAGNDDIFGRGGVDFMLYLFAPGPVTASLTNGTATGEGNDTLDSIEVLVGGFYDDQLDGDGNRNALFGGVGEDILQGFGEDDYLDGESGTDSGSGGGGKDQCVAMENKTGCESTNQRSPFKDKLQVGTKGFRKR